MPSPLIYRFDFASKEKSKRFQIRPEVINFAYVWKIVDQDASSPEFSFRKCLKMGGVVKFFEGFMQRRFSFSTLRALWRKFAQGSESYEKEENFSKNTQDVLLEVSFCSFGFGRLLGSFCVNPRRRRRQGRRSVWRKLKICKFSLVFGKICFFLESLSSVLLFLAGFWRCRPMGGLDESCQSMSRGGKTVCFWLQN